MKIGDRVFVHGYIDEIRKDTVIIRNSGGYFGTAPGEVIVVNDTAHPNWIPCKEKLPEEKVRSYWVCLETGGQCQCRWTNDMYGLGTNEWSTWGWHIMDKPQYSKVIAWIPLPEPYREEKQNDA